MGQIIGKNTLTGLKTSAASNSLKLLYGAMQQVSLSANQKLIGAYIGWGGKTANATASGTGQIGLYDVSGGNYTTAPLLVAVNYSFNNADLSGDQFIYVPMNIDISAHAGKQVAVGVAIPVVSGAMQFDIIYESDIAGAVRKNHNGVPTTLPSAMANSSVFTGQAWAMYFETETIGAGTSIDTLGTSGTVHVGAAENITTTGLGTLTSATVGGVAAAAIAATGGDGTITLADFVDGVVYPAMGTVTTTVGDGTGTASKTDTALTTKTGWQYVNVSGISTTEFSLGNAFGGGDVPTQLHAINDGAGVLNPDGTLTDWAVGTYTAWARMAAGTYTAGTMKSFTFTVHAPVDTAGSDLTLSVSFSSPVISQNFIISPHDLSLSTDFSAPDLSQFVLVQPNDFDVAVQLSQPAISAAGYVQIDDFNLAVQFGGPAIISAANIAVNDWAVSVSLSSPLVGDLPVGPIYADTILQIIDSKIIVKIY